MLSTFAAEIRAGALSMISLIPVVKVAVAALPLNFETVTCSRTINSPRLFFRFSTIALSPSRLTIFPVISAVSPVIFSNKG